MKDQTIRSIDDLARFLGLSKATVSRALNNNPVIAEETRRRVWEAARVHRFTKNVSAQRLTNRVSRTVGFIAHAGPDPCGATDLFSLEIQGGVSQGLRELGYAMMVVPVDFRDPDWVRTQLGSRQVDGFILMTSSRKSRYLKALIEESAPFATWGAASPLAAYPTVAADDFRGGWLVGRHLAPLVGPAAMITGPADEAEVAARSAGYRQARADLGLGFDETWLRRGDYSEASGSRMMAELLAQGRPRSVFVHGDLMAIGALRTLKAAGVAVPEETAVVGFDDLLLASYVDPALTTVSQHIHQAGRALAQALVQYLESGQVTHVVMPVELVCRGSA